MQLLVRAKALEAFAKDAGVQLVACDPEWGGTIAYREADSPNSQVCGFRSERAAYRHWLESAFGEHAGKAVLKLLKRVGD